MKTIYEKAITKSKVSIFQQVSFDLLWKLFGIANIMKAS
jgi:hypothetical protein